MGLVLFALCFFINPGQSIAAPIKKDIGRIPAPVLYQNMSGWAILDARPIKEWENKHIPGALSLSWENYTRTDEKGIAYRILPPQQIADALGKMGIDENTPVVVYGDADTSWGGEGWACWVLSWMGHKGPIHLLDGGIQVWEENTLPIKTGKEDFNGKPKIYHYQIQASINITALDIKNHLPAFQLVDTRSMLEWLKGRISGAVHIPWEKFFSGSNRQPITPSETRELLLQNGINPDRPVIYYCTGGIRSGYAWMVHELAGLPDAVNFEGGMAEWEKTFP